MLTQNINGQQVNNAATQIKPSSANVAAAVFSSAQVLQAAAKSVVPPVQLGVMVDAANKAMEKVDSNLEFSIDDSTNRTVVKVVESRTGETIMQFPTEEMLNITKAIDRIQQGWLLKKTV